jgi:hypothetical protein
VVGTYTIFVLPSHIVNLGKRSRIWWVLEKELDIPFTALDRSFIEKYDLHLRTDCHLALGTIVHLTTSFRTIINEAVADGILTFNPFWGYEPERPQREQKYLTADELELIMTTPLRCESWCQRFLWNPPSQLTSKASIVMPCAL